jgi:hypothetical protein
MRTTSTNLALVRAAGASTACVTLAGGVERSPDLNPRSLPVAHHKGSERT